MSQEEERGQLITQLREQRLWTREHLAKKAGVSPTTVGQAEEGRTHIRLATIGKLAKALEADPQELLHPKKAQAPKSPGRLDDPAYRQALGEFILGVISDTTLSQPLEEQSDQTITAARQSGERGKASGRPRASDAFFVEEDSPERKKVVEEAARVLVEEYLRTLKAGRGSK